MNSISTTAVDTSYRSPASKPRAEPIKGYPISLLQIYWLGFFTINPKSRKSQSNVSKKTISGLALTTVRSSCKFDQAFLSICYEQKSENQKWQRRQGRKREIPKRKKREAKEEEE
ncbi:hypothetical protein Gotur_031154 [Gossypium turneri]